MDLRRKTFVLNKNNNTIDNSDDVLSHKSYRHKSKKNNGYKRKRHT